MQVLLCGREAIPESKYGHVSTTSLRDVAGGDSIVRANVTAALLAG
jgi:hypothetical protein